LEELELHSLKLEYYNSDSYQNKSAKSKRDQLWEEINHDHTQGKFPLDFQLVGFFAEDLKPTFEYWGDAMPATGIFGSYRTKYIHSVGGHGLVSLDAVANPFTGIFKGST